MINELEQLDAWKQNPALPTYTYHSLHTATTLDRFYTTSELQRR